jgi:choline monooxygenase
VRTEWIFRKQHFKSKPRLRAWTLPAELYRDVSILAAEKEKIFSRTWQVVGNGSQVANPTDYFTTELIGEPLLIVRGGDGKLRGFYNVCRHRAGPPAEGCGLRKLFRCGYHGWTYGLDGALLSATEIEGVEGFRPEEFALKPVRTEEWFNLVFVNLDPEARPLRESLGELPAQAEKFPFAQIKLFERRTYDMKCNWKTYVDNYLEGYHLPSVHPGLNRELDYEAERSLAIFEWYLPEKDHGSQAAKAAVEFSHQIQMEDVGIREIVQKNLRSRSYSRGRFSVKQEKGVHAFHRMYGELMRE